MNHEASYLQGRLTEIENQKRLKMAEIAELEKLERALADMVQKQPVPVKESCGVVVEEFYPAGC